MGSWSSSRPRGSASSKTAEKDLRRRMKQFTSPIDIDIVLDDDVSLASSPPRKIGMAGTTDLSELVLDPAYAYAFTLSRTIPTKPAKVPKVPTVRKVTLPSPFPTRPISKDKDLFRGIGQRRKTASGLCLVQPRDHDRRHCLFSLGRRNGKSWSFWAKGISRRSSKRASAPFLLV